MTRIPCDRKPRRSRRLRHGRLLRGGGLLVACLALAATACSAPDPGPATASASASTRSSPGASGRAVAGAAAGSRGALSRTTATQSCASRAYSRLTEPERVGQLFLVGMPDEPPSAALAGAIRAHHFGSVVFDANSTAGVAWTSRVTAAVQALAPANGGVRFFVATNQEGGQIQALRGPGFSAIPSAVAQGELAPATLRGLAATWGHQLTRAGVNLDLAPVMDVVPAGTAARNQPIGALMREFGSSVAVVAAHGSAFVNGMARAGVATTAKHFPGLGRVIGNTDFTAHVVDTTTSARDLGSFQAAIAAGVPMVMVSLATYTRIDPSHLAVFSSRVIGGLLRQQLGFRGVVVSDDMGSAVAVAGIAPAARAVDFLQAGGDLITTVSLAAADAMASKVLRMEAANPAFRTITDAAVMRVLAAKQAYGLLPC